MTKTFLASLALSLVAATTFAQTGTDMVEVEPIKCWWRTSTSAVRTGEAFTLTLTCAVVETEANRVVADFSKLDPTVVTLPPSCITASVRQELMRWPSTITVQAPHWP